ncbi:MAG TPA: PIG-L family deacetylase [Terriglobales bacterium]|nr:PIG-L family deacetylase [Terriglobales bacterium]
MRFLRIGLFRPLSVGLLLACFWLAPGRAADASPASPAEPLPQDTGIGGLKQMLVRLHTTARLMQTVAHPDDEDGGLLTLESRGKGVDVLLLTLNRGEGGQNKIGSNLFDVLGVLRTLELTQSDRYYGVQQRFTRVADFGYSKTPEETFQKWQGHEIPLGDMVRVIRTFRPDVLVARFSGTDRDGHGHHQASNLLTREAFRAAADPNRFPEQIKEGLQPWQPKKLYTGNVCPWGAKTCPDEDYTVRYNTGQNDPLLGMSYIQFAMAGLKHQLSQGAGGWTIEPGDRFAFYKLADSVVPSAKDDKGHEKDFFDGIDTSLPALTALVDDEISKVPFLRSDLTEMQTRVDEATKAADKDAKAAADPLLAGLEITRKTIDAVQKSSLSDRPKDEVLTELRTKEKEFEKAANLASGVEVHAAVDAPVAANADDAFMAVPGQSFDLNVHLASAAKVDVTKVDLEVPDEWKYKEISKDDSGSVSFRVTVPENAQYTRPYWHRNDPERDALNTIDEPQYVTLPFPPPPIHARVTYKLNGKQAVASAVPMVKYKDASGAELERALAVAPAYSVMLEPGQLVIPTRGDAMCRVKVAVTTNLQKGGDGKLYLEVPEGWRSEPASLPLQFTERAEKREAEFSVFHDGMKEGPTQIRAVFESGHKKYGEGYSVVTREDLDTFYYYQPAVQHVSIVDVNVPENLRVGYIMGAGDDIPTVLKQIGMNVTMIPAEKLGSENLSQYDTVVLGIRANDTQKEIAENHQKLLDYVSSGGTLVMQYNTSVSDFNKDDLTPYHAQLSRSRVSVEEAPVQVLAPASPIFHYPNQITQRDFENWVQERGLYFMDQWDDHFTPLLASHDPGESEQKGGLLLAHYGKGTYIYTGYAFFRQLPAGVPGPIRLYVNLLSAGRASQNAVASGQ